MKSHALKYERELRGWSLQKIAEALHVTPRTVSRWERGITVPYPHYREQLCALFGQDAGALGLLPEQQTREEEKEMSADHRQHEASLSLETKAPIYDPMLPQMGTNSLIGRDQFFQQLKLRFCSADSHIISALHGLPGIGKTALAIALASDPYIRAHFCDGVFWAAVGTVPNVRKLLVHWGTLLGISPTEIGDTNSIQDWGHIIRTTIGKRRILLVMDDVWQLDVAFALQVGGPYCAYLITTRISQIAFGFAAEGAIKLPELSDADGLALLAHFSAELVAQEPEQTLALVRSVGGLPLALTLMGKYLATQAYYGHTRRLQRALTELQDAKQRLHLKVAVPFGERSPSLPSNLSPSLYVAINVSNQYLSSSAHEALLALSVFPAKPESFSEEAALAVTGTSIKTLDELSDAGLLENGYSDRYYLHQTIADYAHSQLTGTTAYERLIAYTIDYIERNADDEVALEQESSLILAGLRAAYTLGHHDELVHGICLIAHFLQIRSSKALRSYYLLENYKTYAPLRDAPNINSPLLHIGTCMQTWGNDVHIEIYLEEGLAHARELEDWKSALAFLICLGWITSMQKNYAQAEIYYRAGLVHARQIGDRDRIRMLLAVLGWIAEKCGDYVQAHSYLQEEIQFAREEKDYTLLSILLTSLGWVISKQGYYLQAKAYLQEGLDVAREVGDLAILNSIFTCRSRIALDWEDNDEAETDIRQGLLLTYKIENYEFACILLANLGWIEERRKNYTQAEVHYLEGFVLASQIGHRELLSWHLAGLGWVTYQQKNYAQAEVYVQEALALARLLSHNELLFRLLTIQGRIAEKKGDETQVIEHLQESLIIVRRMKYHALELRRCICSTLYKLGELHLKRGKRDTATANFADMLFFMPQSNKGEIQAKAYYGLARCMPTQGMPS